jgi:hypothetical protein
MELGSIRPDFLSGIYAARSTQLVTAAIGLRAVSPNIVDYDARGAAAIKQPPATVAAIVFRVEKAKNNPVLRSLACLDLVMKTTRNCVRTFCILVDADDSEHWDELIRTGCWLR